MQATINGTTNKRIESIDILRGIAMVIMALDHVRDYIHDGAFTDDPLNLQTTTPLLFFTRWITHFCAPVFVFLSGTSIYLQSLRKTKKELSVFLVKRGLWLMFVEIFIVSLAWTYNPQYHFIPLQVIWAIGISMFILGLLISLPFKVIFITGLLIVAGHNLLDIPESAPGFQPGFWWDLVHSGFFVPYETFPGHYLVVIYPFLPWLGVMMLGYCAGSFFTPGYTMLQRRKIFLILGVSLIVFFIILRYTNVYGDPNPWTVQRNALYTFLSFINLTKYPPSLLFLCIIIGPAFLLLALLEPIKNPLTNVLRVYGRVAFFYYILHLYLIHLIAAILFFARGHSFSEGVNTGQFPFYFVAPGEGYGLAIVYLVWLLVVLMLYPLCHWYNHYKSRHKDKWWLSYL